MPIVYNPFGIYEYRTARTVVSRVHISNCFRQVTFLSLV